MNSTYLWNVQTPQKMNLLRSYPIQKNIIWRNCGVSSCFFSTPKLELYLISYCGHWIIGSPRFLDLEVHVCKMPPWNLSLSSRNLDCGFVSKAHISDLFEGQTVETQSLKCYLRQFNTLGSPTLFGPCRSPVKTVVARAASTWWNHAPDHFENSFGDAVFMQLHKYVLVWS